MTPEERARLRENVAKYPGGTWGADVLTELLDDVERFAVMLGNQARGANDAVNGLAHEVTRLREGIAALPRVKGIYVDGEHMDVILPEYADALLNPPQPEAPDAPA